MRQAPTIYSPPSTPSARVVVEGDLDFRGTLGVDKTVPVGFSAIRLRFSVDSDADEAALATLLKLTERYCVIFQTLRQPSPITAGIEHITGSAP